MSCSTTGSGGSRYRPPDYTERAIYLVEGDIAVGAVAVPPGSLAVLETGTSVRIAAHASSRVMLLGGERFATPRFLWWNFVASSPERIEAAKRDWAADRFGHVPGETEFIPLPIE